MNGRPSSSRLVKGLLILVGVVVAPALAAFGVFGFEDATAAARDVLAREGELVSGAARAAWTSGLEADSFFGELSDPFEVSSEPFAYAPPPHPSAVDATAFETARLFVLAARDALAHGEFDRAIDQATAALDLDTPANGDAFLTVVQAAAASNGQHSLDETFRSAAKRVSFGAEIDGLSGRFLALLAVGNQLPALTVLAEAGALRKAISEGRASLLQDPKTTLQKTAQLDSTWDVLIELAEERLGHANVHWADVFHCKERGASAAVRVMQTNFPDAQPGRWYVSPNQDRFLALRYTADEGWRGGWCDGAALTSGLRASLGSVDDAFRISGFGHVEEGRPISDPLSIPGLGGDVQIVHAEYGASVRRSVRRQRMLQLSFFFAALLLLIASLAAFRVLQKSESLRRMRSTFVASVSHDLRTPIASIGLMAENLKDGYARGNEQKYAETMLRETTRLGRIVDNLLDFGRIERNLPVRLNRTQVDLSRWLDQFAAREEERCHAAKCTLSLEIINLPDLASIDESAVERALSNLIDNACKHSGTETIRLVARGTDESHVQFEVVDRGSGIGGSVREDLFEPFERASETSGTGLGLSIVRAIAEAHGGSASLAQGDDGVGTCARFAIDVRRETAA